MSDDSKSFEKKLDRDFLFYLNLTKELFDNIKTDTEKELCETWLNHLVGKPILSIGEKCDRNIFLSRLLLQMQNGQLLGIFLDAPPSGVLPCAFTTFGLPSEVEGIKGFEESGFQIDSSFGGGSGDFSDSSRDGRTYLATKRLPQGMMAYMAVTNNEDEEIWVPQAAAAPKPEPSPQPGTSGESTITKQAAHTSDGFFKKLLQYVDIPITQQRKKPEEREKVLEWIDKIISDCNKWLQGEDPHNMDLESLFEILYEDYQKDPNKREILKYKNKVRNILIRDIRDKISDRRAEITRRELILDQYEADEYVEERVPSEQLDEVWIQCANRPMNEQIRSQLESIYPPEVVQRFFELLVQERIAIIERKEFDANRRIAEVRNASLDDIKKELQKLKKVQDEYKEYYNIFKEVEQEEAEYVKVCQERMQERDKTQMEDMEKIKREVEAGYYQERRKSDKELRIEMDLAEKLEEAKHAYLKVMYRMKQETERLTCERDKLEAQKKDLEAKIKTLKQTRDELKARNKSGQNKSCQNRSQSSQSQK